MPHPIDPLARALREFGIAMLNDESITLGGLPGRSATATRRLRIPGLTGLTLVVDDLAAAGAALADHLGRVGRAVDPADLDEAGLAQVFDLGDYKILLIEPADDTDAARFLFTHGPGVYRIMLGGTRRLAATTATTSTVDNSVHDDTQREASWSRLRTRTTRRPFAID